MKKYKLTEETLEYKGHTLHRIEALKDFGYVQQGDKGGFVESEDNLSQDYDCWISGNAKVFGNAKVYDNAVVYGNAEVYGRAEVFGDAGIFDGAVIFDVSKVYGCAEIFDNACVYDNAQVYGEAKVYGNTYIFDNAQIYDNAKIYDNAQVYGDAKVYGNAMVFENSRVYSNADIRGDAKVENTQDYIVFKNWWSSGNYITWTRSNNKWSVGCFYGTGEELVEKAYKDSELSGREYKRLVDYVESILRDEKKEMINYEEFDKECIELCKTLNNMDNVETTESCCGHLKNRFVIFFRCNNFSTLAKISRSVNRNYSDGKWELLVVDTDTYPCCNFWLRSKEPFKTEGEMNESVNRLIYNLKYWQKDEFKEYFSNKNNGNYPQ